MPRKKPETKTLTFVMETTPPHLMHLGGDCLLNETTPAGVDAGQAINLSPYQILPGDVVHKASPEAKFHFTTAEDEPDLRTAVTLELSGYIPVMCDDWYFSERIQRVFKPAPDGRMTVGGKSVRTLILWVQPKERMDEGVEANRKWVKDAGRSMEEKMGELGQRLSWAGLSPTMVDETEGREGGVISRRETDFLTRGL